MAVVDNRKQKVQPVGSPAFRQKSIEDWQAPFETNVGKLAKAHPIANVIGLGIPALAQSAAGGVGNAASIMATPDTRPAAKRIEDAVSGSNLVTGIKQVTTPPPPGQMRIALTPAAQAATPTPQKAKPIAPVGGTPMLASHGPGMNTPMLASHGEDLNRIAQVTPEQSATPEQPKAAPIGVMSVEGGGKATIDAQGNITRDATFNAANRADAIKNHGGIGGTLNVMTPEQDAAVSRQAQPIGGGAGDKWSFLEDGSAAGAAKAGIARKLGFIPEDYDRNASKYAAMIAGQGAEYDRNAQAVPLAEIGAEAHKYGADQGLAAHQLAADATVQAAEIGAIGENRKAIATAGLKKQEDESKNAREMQKTFYDSIKGLTLPAGWEGKHMEIAKTLAQDQDPNVDLGIFYSPGQNRQGIAAKKSKFEPLLARYLQAGIPAADAHARAYRDLQELEKQDGVSYHKPFPNLDRLYKNDRKQPDTLLNPEG